MLEKIENQTILKGKFFHIIAMTPFLVIILYLSFRFKQLICDFLLQTEWMALNKSAPGKEGYKALFTHTSIHGAGTAIVMLVFAPGLVWLGFVDFIIHSLIDRTKGVLVRKRGWTPKDTFFWWAFGIDQEAHSLTHLIYLIVVVIYKGGLVLGA